MHIQGYWCIFNHTPLTGTQLRGRREASPALFENRKKCPDFWKNLDFVNPWVKFSIQNIEYM